VPAGIDTTNVTGVLPEEGGAPVVPGAVAGSELEQPYNSAAPVKAIHVGRFI
jgi:hypothetical protein